MKKFYNNYLNYLKTELGYSIHTIKSYGQDLQDFITYLENNELINDDESIIEYEAVLSYIANISYKLDRRSIARKLSSIKSFLKYLFLEGFKTESIYSRIHYGKLPKKLMFAISEADIDAILAQIEGDSVLDWRNRLIIELLYATGIRVSELTGLKFSDINYDTKQLKILGKGQKFRMVFFNTMAETYLKTYLNLRNNLIKSVDTENDFVFLNRFGTQLTTRSIERLFNTLSKKASLTTRPTPHTMRHSFASHLLNNGADIKTVKELLGHSSISTTEKYTHISLDNLKKVYNKSHPRGKSYSKDKKDS